MEEKKSFREFLTTGTGGLALTLICYVVCISIMLIVGSFGNNGGDSTVGSILSLIVVGVWAVFGWKGLSKIQPNIFLIMPIAGWVVYIIVKGILSIVLGIFIAPYQISKMIRNSL